MGKQISILVVEDDIEISELLCNIMKKSGYFAKPAYSGTEAVIYVENQEWDMILLDLMLPGMRGEDVLVKIREKSSVPIIILSARSEQQTKIDVLRIGADDFITKPFDIEEVSARIDSHLRRYIHYTNHMKNSTLNKSLNHKDIYLNLDTKEVIVNGVEIILTAREYAILNLLMSCPKKVFTKPNLFESIWGTDFLGDDNTINVHMSNLRNKLANANPCEEYIETIWGMGYRLK
ncbi:response regulator transcription factor [Bacillus paramycoides]|uniref:Response regulatory domain-containing protein n=1 Tax=Bacillus cereus HuA2-1 TaxID=1053201 RepID=J9C8Q1_BACCE|nr:response regulator transcription factor [Bacillus cereus]EJV87821.1 hypothetical protein IG3_01308 [Bacillus cereus HuA2-1]